MRALVVGGMLAGCVTPASGQRVTVILQDRTVTCVAGPEEGDPAVATLQLAAENDLYMVQLENLGTGELQTLPAAQSGTTVTWVCPDGFDDLVVRTASLPATGVEGGDGGSRPAP